jgi:hypothetical protein
MNNTDGPKVFDLKSARSIWIRPDSSAILKLDFGRPVAGITFQVKYSQYRWNYAPSAYDILEPGEITPVVKDGNMIFITIDQATVNLFRDRRIDLNIIATESGNTWVACSAIMTVNNGN